MANELIKQLREDVNFQAIMADMLKMRPVIPEYTPQDTMDKTANLMEEIKYKSAKRSGFDLLYRALVGRPPE